MNILRPGVKDFGCHGGEKIFGLPRLLMSGSLPLNVLERCVKFP